MAIKKDSGEIQIFPIKTETAKFFIVGTTPLIINRMPEKAQRQLLLPPARKNAAAKAASLKHDPIAEFKSSAYLDKEPDSPTYLQHLATAFKGAMCNAALDLPGATKAQLGRLSWVEGERVAIYGIPKVLMSVVRCADINRTPDIRTRCIIPEWVCELSVTYVRPNLTGEGVANLLGAAGITQGIGDWRTGKGKGTFGAFRLASEDDAEFKHVQSVAGRDAQIEAMENFDFYDEESAELYGWFDVEAKRREFKVAS